MTPSIHCKRCGQPGHMAKTCTNEPRAMVNCEAGWAYCAACPYCGAEPWQRCIGQSPRIPPREIRLLHPERVLAARELEESLP